MDIGSLRVIVCGAATGGCGAALLLARAGARITLAERVTRPRAIGAGIAIAENGLAVLDSLGISLPGKVVHDVRITDASGRTLLAPRGRAPRAIMVRRSTLQGALLDAVAREPRITPMFGHEVVGVTPDARATIGGAGGQRVIQGDLVIGADGVHSRVRAGADFGARVRGSGIRYVRLLTDADVATGVEAWTAAGIIGAFAVDGGTYAFASCGTAALRSALDRRDLDAFRATWTAAYPPAARILGSVRSFDELIINEVIRVDCARWFQGRLALLGDAAHAMAPNLGQGANSALVDGAVLLDELRRAPDLATGLEAYQRRRRPAVRRVALTAAHLGRLAEVTNPLMRAARDRLLLPIASRLSRPGAIAQMMQEPSDVLRAIGSA